MRLLSIIKMLRSSRFRWMGHVARIEKRGIAYSVLVGEHEEPRSHGRPRLDRRIKLKWILKKEAGKVWTGFIWLRLGTSDWLL
jgi:DNA-binding protein H-NS